jgi:hypothetical protein
MDAIWQLLYATWRETWRPQGPPATPIAKGKLRQMLEDWCPSFPKILPLLSEPAEFSRAALTARIETPRWKE